MKKLLLIFTVILCIPLYSLGQNNKNVSEHPKMKIGVVSGNPDLFKEVKNYYVTFDYSDLQVEKYGNEAAYIVYMKDDAERRKQGSSGAWLNKWYGDRRAVFQPKFIEVLNKYLPGDIQGDTILNNQNYTLNLHTTYTDIGFNRNFQHCPSYINTMVTISDMKDPARQLVISMTDVPGEEVMASYSADFRRIEEAYAKCGKELAQFLSKVIY